MLNNALFITNRDFTVNKKKPWANMTYNARELALPDNGGIACFKKEIELKASFINPYTQKRALELIDHKKIDVSSIVYAYEGLDQLPVILSDAKLRAKGKFIIKPQK